MGRAGQANGVKKGSHQVRSTISIPTIAGRETLMLEALDSAKNQTVPCCIDVVSATGPDAVNEPEFYKVGFDPGPYALWYLAAKRCKTEFINLLHDDDWHEPDFIERCESMFSNSSVAYVMTQANVRDGETVKNNAPINTATGIYPSSDFEVALFEIDLTISPCCVLFRTKDVLDFLQVAPLPIPNPPKIGHDLLLCLMPLLRRSKVGWISEPMTNFRAHKNSYTTNALSTPLGKYELKSDYSKAREWFLTVKKLWGCHD
jgi:hypothetical protein